MFCLQPNVEENFTYYFLSFPPLMLIHCLSLSTSYKSYTLLCNINNIQNFKIGGQCDDN